MRIILTFLLISLFVVIKSGCSENRDSIDRFILNEISGRYDVKIEYRDGQENTQIADVSVDNRILENLGLSQNEVLIIIDHAIIQTKFQLQNIRSFSLRSRGSAVSVLLDDNMSDINVLVNAIGSNAYGVEGEISAVVKYDRSGNHKSTFTW